MENLLSAAGYPSTHVGVRGAASRACNVRYAAGVGVRGRGPIRTRACVRVATAGPAKPVTHAAPRHQHQLGTPTPTPNGAPARVSLGREHHPPAVPLCPSLRPPPLSSYVDPHLRLSLLRALSLFLLSLPRSLALRSSVAPPRANTTGICAIIKPRLLRRGYTPIDPEVPSNGQLENRLGFPRSHPPRATSPRPLAPAERSGRVLHAGLSHL